jgi:SAM-dependent methyltransferase
VHDLNILPLPFPDNEFHLITASQVLEHCGRQGDWKFFFDQFTEFWRILKPHGHLSASVPHWKSQWAWGDPSHTRVITPGTLLFLSQREYDKQVGVTTMSDFRFCYHADFEIHFQSEDENHFHFDLIALKD